MKLCRYGASYTQNGAPCWKLKSERAPSGFALFARIDRSRHSVHYLGPAVTAQQQPGATIGLCHHGPARSRSYPAVVSVRMSRSTNDRYVDLSFMMYCAFYVNLIYFLTAGKRIVPLYSLDLRLTRKELADFHKAWY